MKTSKIKECSCRKSEIFQFPIILYNRPGISQISYRIGSYSSFRQSMINQITQSPKLSDWTSRNNTDYGMVIINMWAYLSDILTFYQERIANEAFLRTAVHRDSIIRMASMLDYKLNPGAAATTYLIFELEKDSQVKIPNGLKVQSVPRQDEKPQKFETVESISAFSNLNEINILKTQPLSRGIKEFIIKGIHSDLEVGDYLLIIGEEHKKNPGSENWDVRKLHMLTFDKENQTTTVFLDKGLGHRRKDFLTDKEKIEVFSMKNVAWPFGANAPEWKPQLSYFYLFSLNCKKITDYLKRIKDSNKHTISQDIINNFKKKGLQLSNGSKISNIVREKKWKIIEPNDEKREYILEINDNQLKIFLKKYLEDWTGKTLPEDPDHPNFIFLDNIYEDIKPNSWIALITPDPPPQEPSYPGYKEVYLVKIVDKIVHTNYLLTFKVTRLIVDGIEKNSKIQPEHIEYFPIQKTFILSQNKRLELVGRPDQNYVMGDKLYFDQYYPDLKSGRNILIKGKIATKGVSEACEVVQIEDVEPNNLSQTVVNLKKNLINSYERKTVKIYGNVVKATHGETVLGEILGGGDPSIEFQEFILKKHPTTFIHAANSPKGIKNTLQVRVGDILWDEVESFYGQKSEDMTYITQIDNDGRMIVRSGDGKTSVCPTTGRDNIVATYRWGLGSIGNVPAYALKTLLDQPLGVKSVNNPDKAQGGTDAESLFEARINIPNTVRTFERAVSLKDYEDIAREFTGIAKAKAIFKVKNDNEIIQLTIAGDKGEKIDINSQIFYNFINYLNLHRDCNQPVEIIPHENINIHLKINIRTDPTYLEEIVKSEIKNSLFNYFNFDNLQLGQTIHLSNIYRTLQKVKGVIAARIDHLYKENNLKFLEKHVEIPPNFIANLKDENLTINFDL